MNILYRILRKIRRLGGHSYRKVVRGLKLLPQNPKGEMIIQHLPGLVYGFFRNVAPYKFVVDASISRARLTLLSPLPEVLHFNHIAIWTKAKDGHFAKYDGPYECNMSSTSNVLPDPHAVMHGDGSNSVSVHSVRELNPWWEISFPSPVNVAYIMFYNRKDVFGKRAKSLQFSFFDEENNLIMETSKVSPAGALESFSSQCESLIEPACSYLSKTVGDRVLAERLKSQLISLASTVPYNPAQAKQELLDTLERAHVALRRPTPDLPDSVNDAFTYSLPNNARKLRVIGFRRKLKRPVTLKVLLGDEVILLNETRVAVTAQINKLKDSIWSLQHPHHFQLELPENPDNVEVSLFCDDFYSQNAFVQRLVEYQDANGNWHLLESTLDNLQARLGILTIHEWLIGMEWDRRFIRHLSHLLATYRMSQARTVKPLLRSKRHLLPHFYHGVEDAGHSATYIPAVTYTRHGLTVPFKELDSSFLAGKMHAFTQYLKDQYNLDAFPCYGTLLGIYRDNDFLPHDDDIDLAAVVDLPANMSYRQATEMWAERFKADGMDCRSPTPTSLNLHCYFDEFDMDLFLIYRMPGEPNKVMTHMEGYKVRPVKRDLLEPLTETEFKGYTFKIPENVESFLKDRYGPGWQVPDPTFEL